MYSSPSPKITSILTVPPLPPHPPPCLFKQFLKALKCCLPGCSSHFALNKTIHKLTLWIFFSVDSFVGAKGGQKAPILQILGICTQRISASEIQRHRQEGELLLLGYLSTVAGCLSYDLWGFKGPAPSQFSFIFSFFPFCGTRIVKTSIKSNYTHGKIRVTIHAQGTQ